MAPIPIFGLRRNPDVEVSIVLEGEDESFPEQDDFRMMFGLGFSF